MIRTKRPGGDVEIIIPEVTPIEFKRGVSTKFNGRMIMKMFEMAKLGLTQEKLALALDINIATLHIWMREYPKFRRSYEEGRDIYDNGVHLALQKRAMGYNYEEVKEFEGVDSLGRAYHYTTKVNKHVPPETTAGIFWLKNRHPTEWRDVHRAEINSNVNLNLNKTLKLELLSTEEREMIEGIAIKQISDMNGISTD